MKLNDLLALAESSFAFLLSQGFALRNRTPALTETFRDGWILEYHSAPVDVRVEYLDWQFNVIFRHAGVSASYLTIDIELHARRSGFYGDMFPPDKLAEAIEKTSADISAHYADVLVGDAGIWAKLKKLSEAPTTKRRFP